MGLRLFFIPHDFCVINFVISMKLVLLSTILCAKGACASGAKVNQCGSPIPRSGIEIAFRCNNNGTDFLSAMCALCLPRRQAGIPFILAGLHLWVEAAIREATFIIYLGINI